MPDKDTTPANNQPKPDEIDQAIIHAVTLHPDSATNDIANKLIRAGTINSRDVVYKRLLKRDYLSRDIEQIRANHREQISRELMPEALKVTRKALKDKTMSAKDKHPYVSMVIKSDLGDQGADNKPTMINIEHLERMQVIMGK